MGDVWGGRVEVLAGFVMLIWSYDKLVIDGVMGLCKIEIVYRRA